MSDQSRSLPDRPNLRFLKLEAKQRLSAGEFDTLHNAQLAIAREHGMSSWTVLKDAVAGRSDPDSHALTQVRWLTSRFRDADDTGWAPPSDTELREHLEDRFLARVRSWRLVAQLAGQAARFREDLVVLEREPLTVRAQAGGLRIEAATEAMPPYRVTALQAYPVGSLVRDPRVTQPPVGQAEGDVPAGVTELADEALGEVGLPGLVLAGGTWATARGWADLDSHEALRPAHRFPALGLTKLITAVAVLRLVADGRVDLDAPADDHRLGGVTVRELLTHTGGVETAVPLFADAVPDLVALTSGERGTFRYSNGGYVALGALIADVTGSRYESAVAGLVLAPLGMSTASFPSTWPADSVTGYRLSADGLFPPVRRQVCTMPAAAGLWATAGDLVRFATGWSTLLPESLAREALTPHAPAVGTKWARIGLGWLLDQDDDLAGLQAAAAGSAASVVVHVGSGQACVALANRQVPVQPITTRAIGVLTGSGE